MSRWLLRAGCWLLLLAVAGCTGTQQVTVSGGDAQRAELRALSQWEFTGKIAFRNSADGGQAKLRWQQQDATSRIRVAGPLGAGAYEITWVPDRITVQSGGGEQSLQYRGSDAAEQFMRDQLGWAFPARSTRYWLLGLLDPAARGSEVLDDAGNVTGLSQHGWDVRYERYAEVRGFTLPAKLEMSNGEAALRIVISRWQLPEADD